MSYITKQTLIMETLIIHLDKTVSKSKIKEALRLIPGIESVSDKITLSDFEDLAEDILIQEMKKADNGLVLSFKDGKKEFTSIKQNLLK